MLYIYIHLSGSPKPNVGSISQELQREFPRAACEGAHRKKRIGLRGCLERVAGWDMFHESVVPNKKKESSL